MTDGMPARPPRVEDVQTPSLMHKLDAIGSVRTLVESEPPPYCRSDYIGRRERDRVHHAIRRLQRGADDAAAFEAQIATCADGRIDRARRARYGFHESVQIG